MSDTDLALKLFVVLSRSHRALARVARADIARHDLGFTEFAVLEALYHKGELKIGELGQRVLLTSGTMTYVVDKLARRELLERRVCATDQRVTYLRITTAGKRLMRGIFPAHANAICAASAGLSQDEKLAAIALLKKLGYEAQRMADERE